MLKSFRTKHKDEFYDLVKVLAQNLGSAERSFVEIEMMIEEHRKNPTSSRLARSGVLISSFFTELKLTEAFKYYDKEYCISNRKYVPLSFKEVRHIFNLSQLFALTQTLRLVTFDADGTLYEDGANLNEKDQSVIMPIIALLENNFYIAIITAAGYPKQSTMYDTRFSALLKEFEKRKFGPEILSRFFVIGGECNYLLQCNERYELEYKSDDWLSESYRLAITPDAVTRLLNESEKALKQSAKQLNLESKMKVIRKERAVGYISLLEGWVPRTEVLNEIVVNVQESLAKLSDVLKIPYCAFNSGKDVWIDVGHKSIACSSLQDKLKVLPNECLHIGDQMTALGNDYLVRNSACTLWVTSPKETSHLLELLLQRRESYNGRNGDENEQQPTKKQKVQ